MSQTARLHHVIARGKTVQNDAHTILTALHHQSQRHDAFYGLARTYQRANDEGDELDPQFKDVEIKVEAMLTALRKPVAEHIDVVATKDATNAHATADIVLRDGTVVAENVPATTLLFLEKQLVDLGTFMRKLPTLDPTERWSDEPDPVLGVHVTEPVRTLKTTKVPRFHTVAEATAHHPAQVAQLHEDVTVGYWTTVKQSGALVQRRRDTLVARVTELLEAVRIARETANTTPVADLKIGEAVMDYLLAV